MMIWYDDYGEEEVDGGGGDERIGNGDSFIFDD